MSMEDTIVRCVRYRISGERARDFTKQAQNPDFGSPLDVSGEGKPRRELQKVLRQEFEFALNDYDQALQLRFQKFLNEWVKEFCIEVADHSDGDFGVRVHDDSLEDVVTFPSLRAVLKSWADDFDPAEQEQGNSIAHLRSFAAYLEALASEMEGKCAQRAKSQTKG